MFLVMSADYICQELESEFGKIPPSFLPLGNKRLFKYQFETARNDELKIIALPSKYRMSPFDQLWFDENGIEIIMIPEGLSLGHSFVSAINLIDVRETEDLTVLFGDTLFKNKIIKSDFSVVSKVENDYKWSIVDSSLISDDNLQKQHGISELAISGIFCFSDIKSILREVISNDFNFIYGVTSYAKNKSFSFIESNDWMDFGHVNTYYRSRTNYTTQRDFNNLKITNKWVEKSSNKNEKIRAEAQWYINIPDDIKLYTPRFLSSKDNFSEANNITYKIEYLYQLPLNELFVFGKLSELQWKVIIEACFEFVSACIENKSQLGIHSSSNFLELMSSKTLCRLEQYAQYGQIDVFKSYSYDDGITGNAYDILELADKYLPNEVIPDFENCVLHGDFCFSNIVFDFRTNRVITYDPRGISPNGNFSIYGNVLYDIGKLSHSIIGLYDFIISKYYEISWVDDNFKIDFKIDERIKNIQNKFLDIVMEKYQLTFNNVLAIQIHLFLSMIPLHDDDPSRQEALFVNAFRLANLIGEKA